MPFGKKEVPKKVSNDVFSDTPTASDKPLKIDFHEIYAKPLVPALEKSGCQPFEPIRRRLPATFGVTCFSSS
jgi:hypothetical protein